MKTIFILTIVVACYTSAQSQQLGDREKMKVVSDWIGRWQGESSMKMGPGEPKKSMMDERIEYKLDGMILAVEGKGTAKDNTGKEFITHHAFAILSYNKLDDKYKFKTYLSDGRGTDAWFTVVSANNFEWGFDTPQGRIKYTIQIDPSKKTWYEVGEFSSDSATWNKFFEMTLTKVE